MRETPDGQQKPQAESAPIDALSRAVRDDVGRLTRLLRAIRTPYTVVGLLGLVSSAAIGVSTAILTGFHDWYMHLAMFVGLTALVLLYFRSVVRGSRLRSALYAIFGAALLLFFAWILFDLAPPRLEIVGDRWLSGGGLAPDVQLRPAAPLLIVSAWLLTAVAAWLLFHRLALARRR